MGAKIAYELEKRLEQSGIYARHLIVSGSRPPHIPEPNPICNYLKGNLLENLPALQELLKRFWEMKK